MNKVHDAIFKISENQEHKTAITTCAPKFWMLPVEYAGKASYAF